jgi:hypothetical protein
MVKHSYNLALIIVVLIFSLFATGCAEPSAPASPAAPETDQAPMSYAGKKVLFINSYHEGYEWSDGIEDGLHSVLDNTGVELRLVRMDTKNHPEEAARQAAGKAAFAEIEAFKPDVVIAADDNAQTYVVVPYLKDSTYPVIFIGVNWDASTYDYSNEHITGMVEIEFVDEMVGHLKEFAEGDTVGYVTVGSETEDFVAETYNKRFFDSKMVLYRVSSWEEYKEAFLKAQDEVNIVFLGNNAGVDWPADEADQFFRENTRVPTGSINSWMASYALLTLAKDPVEQGEWGGEKTLEILDGTPTSAIEIARNKRGSLILNLDIAEQLDIIFPTSLLRNATIYEKSSQ